MAGVEEENYLDKLLNSVGSQDPKEEQDETSQQEVLVEQEEQKMQEMSQMPEEQAEEAMSQLSEEQAEETLSQMPEEQVEEAMPQMPEEQVEEAMPQMSEEQAEEAMPQMPEEQAEETMPQMQKEQEEQQELSEVMAMAMAGEEAKGRTADGEKQTDDDENADQPARFDPNLFDGDFNDLNLSDNDMEWLAGMDLDSLIDDISSEHISVDELFGNKAAIKDLENKNETDALDILQTQADLSFDDDKADDSGSHAEDMDKSKTVQEAASDESVPEPAAPKDVPEAAKTDSLKEAPISSEMQESVSIGEIKSKGSKDTISETAGQAEQSEETQNMKANAKKKAAANQAAADMATEELPGDTKKKKKKGGLGSLIKGIFFEGSQEEPAEASKAKDAGKKASKQAEAEKKDAIKKEVKAEKKAEQGEESSLDENQKLLYEMYANEQEEEAAPKKGFFAKIKYRFEQMVKKNAEEDQLEQEAEDKEYEERQKLKEEKKEQEKQKKEEAKKEQKEKKESKAKAKAEKPKKEKKPKPEPKPGDILKIKPASMFLFISFVAGVILLLCVLNSSVNYTRAVSVAKASMENGNFEKAYEALSGLKLSKDDQTLYKQASIVMYVQRQNDAHDNYYRMGMRTEAINALIKGLERYDQYYDEGKELSVAANMDEAKSHMIEKLRENYGISEAEAQNLLKMSHDNFTQYYSKIEAYGRAGQ